MFETPTLKSVGSSFPTCKSLSPTSDPKFAIPNRFDAYLVLLAALSLIALGPLLQPGYFWGAHDARHSVYFLFEFDRVFSEGVWYPRWLPDFTFGYGYPFFNIYSPGAYFVGEFLHLAGFDFIASVKIIFGASFILSGLAMYGLVKRLFDSRAAGFVAGLAYVYNPYHLVDVYVRANLAESVAVIFLPLTLWAFYETIVAPRVRSLLFASITYAALVFSHSGLALLFSPLLGVWIVFLLAKRIFRQAEDSEPGPTETTIAKGSSSFRALRVSALEEFLRAGILPAASLLLGLGLTSIFFIPLFFEYKDVNTAQWTANYYAFAEHFVEPFQLFNPAWGFGISVAGPNDGLSFQLGLLPLALAFFSLFALANNTRGIRPILIFFSALTLIVIALMLEPSRPLWDVLNLVSFAQFPWRLLGLTMVSLSVLAGALFVGEPESDSTSLSFPALLLGTIILLASYPYITAQNSLEPKEGPIGLAALMNFELNANELTGVTRWVKEIPTWSPLADNWVAGKRVRSKVDLSAKPESLYIGQTQAGFGANYERIAYNSPTDAEITFYVPYYPGWKVYLLKTRSNERIRELKFGEDVEIVDPYAQIRVRVPAGEYFLLLTFEDTPPRTAGKIISALSLVIVGGIFLQDLYQRAANKKQ